jgi:hypothetical protein
MSREHAAFRDPYPAVRTVVCNIEHEINLACVAGAIFPPVDAVVEIGNRDVVVLGVRLVLPGRNSSEVALVRVDVSTTGSDVEIPRHPVDRLA